MCECSVKPGQLTALMGASGAGKTVSIRFRTFIDDFLIGPLFRRLFSTYSLDARTLVLSRAIFSSMVASWTGVSSVAPRMWNSSTRTSTRLRYERRSAFRLISVSPLL
jgi:hypothetical protein